MGSEKKEEEKARQIVKKSVPSRVCAAYISAFVFQEIQRIKRLRIQPKRTFGTPSQLNSVRTRSQLGRGKDMTSFKRGYLVRFEFGWIVPKNITCQQLGG